MRSSSRSNTPDRHSRGADGTLRSLNLAQQTRRRKQAGSSRLCDPPTSRTVGGTAAASCRRGGRHAGVLRFRSQGVRVRGGRPPHARHGGRLPADATCRRREGALVCLPGRVEVEGDAAKAASCATMRGSARSRRAAREQGVLGSLSAHARPSDHVRPWRMLLSAGFRAIRRCSISASRAA